MPAYQQKISLWLQCQQSQSDKFNERQKTKCSSSSPPAAKRACLRRGDAKPYTEIIIDDNDKAIDSRSGIEGFPSLLNCDKQLLVRLCSWKTELESKSDSQILLLYCKIIANETQKQQKLNKHKQQITVLLRDNWVHEIPPLRVGYLLRLIDPTKTGENCYELTSTQLQMEENNSCNNDGSLLVFEPHTLISSTALAQSLYCPRKALFQDRFRSSGSTLAMTVGTIAHELFQIALFQRPTDLSARWLFCLYRRRFLSIICLELIAMQCSLERFEEELCLYLDNISQWIKTHVSQSSTPKNGTNYPKAIAHIRQQQPNDAPKIPFFYTQTHDIEENVWTPTIGVKGRIDVSFIGSYQQDLSQLKTENRISISQRQKVFPLELKTGKTYGAAGSIEHQSQVMLYTLMLSERSNDGKIEPGFLLYMRDNSLAQVHPNAIQLRGIIQMRNRLAVNFSRFTLDSFPEPLTNPRSCQYCPYSTLCGTLAFANNVEQQDKAAEVDIENKENIEVLNNCNNNLKEANIKVTHASGLHKHSPSNDFCCLSTLESFNKSPYQLSQEMHGFLNKSIKHLSPLEIRYARHWIARCLREWGHLWERGSTLRLFRHSPEEREAQGAGIANLHLNSISTQNNNEEDQPAYLMHFTRQKPSNNAEQRQKQQLLVLGTFVTLSTDQTYALLMGTIHAIDDSYQSIVVLTDKQLPSFLNGHPQHKHKIRYHLDKHDGFTIHAMALGNISALLEDTPNCNRVRSIFTTGRLLLKESRNLDNKIINDEKDRDEDIIKATARRILNTPDYALVRADRKAVSSLLVWLARCLLRLGNSVLFCANNNATIDELLLQFKKFIPTNQLLRIGSAKSINSELTELLVENKLAIPSLKQLESGDAAKALFVRAKNLVLEQKPLLVASTLHSVPSNAFFACSQRRFNFCLLLLNNIDDPTYTAPTLPDSLLCAPLLRSDRFALFDVTEEIPPESANVCTNDIPLMQRLELFLRDADEQERRQRMFNLFGGRNSNNSQN